MKHALHLVYDSEVNPGNFCRCEKCLKELDKLAQDIQKEIDQDIIKHLVRMVELKYGER